MLCLVLSSRQSLIIGYNPETSSRVTLASLGTVFQTDHSTKQQTNNLPTFHSLPFSTYYIYTALESGCAFLRSVADALT